MDHLTGKLTLGTYLLNSRSEARFIVLDADDDSQFDQLTDVAPKVAEEGAPGYLEGSRRGGHLWMFFAQAIPAKDARAFGKGIMATYQLESVELFPKQDRLSNGPGSLIRLPFGVHRKTGRRYGFVTPKGDPLASTIRKQIELFSHPRPVSETVFETYQSVSTMRSESKTIRVSSSNAETVSGRIKEAMSVLEFVSQYIDLDSRGRGRCPFHEDEHTSFAVNDQKNYWSCFAGCGGGSNIDFWSKWREKYGQDHSFVATITDLADMLL
jgi:hypothetical protein